MSITRAVTIGYDTPWRLVHELLLKAARQTEGVLADPAPMVLQSALDDSYVAYRVGAAMDPASGVHPPVFRSRLHQQIHDVFAAAGVEILSPTYCSLRDGDPDALPPGSPSGPGRAFRVAAQPGPAEPPRNQGKSAG